MIARILRTLALKRELDRNLAARRLARKSRAEAAQRGVSTELKRRGDKCRAMFGEMAR